MPPVLPPTTVVVECQTTLQDMIALKVITVYRELLHPVNIPVQLARTVIVRDAVLSLTARLLVQDIIQVSGSEIDLFTMLSGVTKHISTLCLSLTRTHSLIHSLTYSYTLSLTHTLSLSLSLSLSLTHTHSWHCQYPSHWKVCCGLLLSLGCTHGTACL